ncbi:tetratricopeptide repeat protein [Novipirellula artificiosorum]|uniref:Tetratricopeptide repeat protein n=1 Tax=Novipirellula artificiosorum TaxID=2528016 RepID=A0A5C6DEN9_9BACT|nr:hypothetical protein [Novipirellula artificiosorum]TWU34394.1 hypothetical protein Poly41_45420 [Novipirellula artificiosorum]
MGSSFYLSCLWPGLPEIWWRGRLKSLPLAVGFAIALNLFLITGWVFPRWISGGLFWMGSLVGLVVWGYYVVRGIRELPELIHPRQVSEEPDRFTEAHLAYLQADWRSCEKLLTGVLAIEPRDPPSLIMLSAVYRHQSRLADAETLLGEIGRLEVADAWWVEIATERRRLQRAIATKQEEQQGGVAAESGSSNEPVTAADMTEATKQVA